MAICILDYFHRTVQDRAQLRSGDGVALPLSLTVGVVGLTLREGPLIRLKNYLAKKFVMRIC